MLDVNIYDGPLPKNKSRWENLYIFDNSIWLNKIDLLEKWLMMINTVNINAFSLILYLFGINSTIKHDATTIMK